MRIYQGMVEKGMSLMNVRTGKKVRVPRIARMHSNNMEVSARCHDISLLYTTGSPLM